MSSAVVLAYTSEQKDLNERLYEEVRAKRNYSIDILNYNLDERSLLDLHPWFMKPLVIQEALKKYNSVLWLDNDIEVKNGFDEVFNCVKMNKMGMVYDYARPMYNTGVILAAYGECSLLDQWCEKVQDSPTCRGDQELLSLLRAKDCNKWNDDVFSLPDKYNCMRLRMLYEPETPEDLIVHWTGAIGKAHLRKKYGLG